MVAPFVCKQCHSSVRTLSRFYRRIKMHRNMANFGFGCDLLTCPCSFETLPALTVNHTCVRSTHSQITLAVDRLLELFCEFPPTAFLPQSEDMYVRSISQSRNLTKFFRIYVFMYVLYIYGTTWWKTLILTFCLN